MVYFFNKVESKKKRFIISILKMNWYKLLQYDDKER